MLLLVALCFVICLVASSLVGVVCAVSCVGPASLLFFVVRWSSLSLLCVMCVLFVYLFMCVRVFCCLCRLSVCLCLLCYCLFTMCIVIVGCFVFCVLSAFGRCLWLALCLALSVFVVVR